MSRVFLSHASVDKPVIDHFVNLILEGALEIPSRDIFYSSQPEKIPSGMDFNAYMREKIDGAELVIFMVSKNFLGRPFCLCEMGAAWVQTKRRFPIVVPPATFGDLTAVLSGLQGRRLDDRGQLDALGSELAKALGLDLNLPRWNRKLDAFFGGLPTKLEELPDHAPVSRQAVAKLEEELEQYKDDNQRAHAEITTLKEQNEALVELKDREEVAAVLSNPGTEPEEFERMADLAQEALSGLSGIVQNAIYKDFRGEGFVPDDWNDAESDIENGYLDVSENGRHVTLNPSRRDVTRAVGAVRDLYRWLRTASGDFESWYGQKYDEYPVPSRRDFWERHLFN